MSNKNNYQNFYNQKPAETPTPAEENKELEPVVTEGDAAELPEGTPVVPAADENTDPELPENNEEGNDESNTDEDAENIEDENESTDPEPETHNVQKVRVTVKSLNVRNEADKESDIITVVNKDDELELRESTSVDGFYAVKTKNGTFGYCMEEFVELV